MFFILIVIYVVFISLGLPDSLFGVAWPVVHSEFGISESFASVYSIIIGVCTGGVSFVSGKLIRKFGTSRVTLVSVLITALGLVAISFSPNIAVMMISSVIMGYGAGAIDTGLNNFVSLHYKAQHMNWLHCFWGVGVTVSPLIMSLFLGDGGSEWRKGYRVVALLQLLIAVLVLFSLKKWKGIERAEKEETVDESDSAGIADIIKIKGVLTGILSLGAYCSMEFLLGTWGASYAVNVFAVSPDVAAKWVSLYYGGIMVGRVISGFLSIKLSDKGLIRGGVVVALIGIIIFALPLGTASLFGFFLIGMGFGPVFPSVLHSVPERFGAKYSADITGYHMGGAYAIGFGIQLIYGFAATNITFGITPFVLIGLCTALVIFNEITVKKTNT
ncbi:MAG: MFS transporter [Ruminococcaceae bacterium]|nr:MFS transporter [Oscillospiraceae bacterium]